MIQRYDIDLKRGRVVEHPKGNICYWSDISPEIAKLEAENEQNKNDLEQYRIEAESAMERERNACIGWTNANIKIMKLKAKNEKLKKALKYYAEIDPLNIVSVARQTLNEEK